jgi:thymidylate kinase
VIAEPIIVLEGPDGSGKTTLGRALAGELHAHYLHCSYRYANHMHTYHTAVLELALRLAQHRPVIIDRWWPSEQVYARTFRRKTRWPMSGRMLDRVALKHGITYVLCLPANKAAYLFHFQKLKADRQEMFATMEGVYSLYEAWNDLNSEHPNLMLYDWMDGEPFHHKVQRIRHQANNNIQTLPDFAKNRTDRRFAGNPYADVVLVGDRSNPKTRRGVWPFFDYGHCSLWFTETLARLGVPEYNLGWMNLHDSEGKVQWSHNELNWFNDLQLIAMGGSAQKSLRHLGFKFSNVAHPQWYRRFQTNEQPTDLINLFDKLRITHHDAEYRDRLGLA